MSNTFSPIVALWPSTRNFLVTCASSDTKGRKPSNLISRPDEVAVGVDIRQRKAGSRIEDWKHGETVRQRKAGPDEHAIGRVPRERSALVGPDHRVLDVAEEAVEVVEVADRRRARVGRDNAVVAVERITRGDL